MAFNQLAFIAIFTFAASVSNSNAQNQKDAINTSRIEPVGVLKNLTDDQLLDVVQKQTFRYFWDFAHPVSGMAR